MISTLEPLTLRSPIAKLTYEMLFQFTDVLVRARPYEHQADLDPLARAPEKGWKEVKFLIPEDEPPTRDATRNDIMPCAYALVNCVRKVQMQKFPYAELPFSYSAEPAAKLEMATVTHPTTGISLRGRRWHSVERNADFMAFDIASEGYESPIGTQFVGPWLVA